MSKSNGIRRAFAWHKALLWVALGTLLIFVLSAFCHLLLTWTGPQTSVTRPPAQRFTAADVQAIAPILQRHGIHTAQQVKLVPSASGALLQVTENAAAPRRYFELNSGSEVPGQDEQQARWLAAYYLDGYLDDHLDDASRVIDSVEFQTVFDNDYPWVNRLLPVYKVRVAGDEGLTLYVHTESLALASISNHGKHRLQWVFRQLHTFEWLEHFRHGRVLLMALLLCSVLAMLGSGLCLLYVLKRHSPLQGARRAHRMVAHVVAIPLLGFSASGLYHLLHSEYASAPRDFNLARPLSLEALRPLSLASAALPDAPLHSVALLALGEETYYRASVAEAAPASGGEHDHHSQHPSAQQLRQQRFDGVPKEQGAVYLSQHGTVTDRTDEQVARQLALDHVGIRDDEIARVEKVTRFGPDYDFRNKRLPVWRVDIHNASREFLFIDVASGLLVDRVNRSARMEGYSFSLLHKWNFLTFPLGREKRDALIALVLLLALGLAGLGIRLRKPF